MASGSERPFRIGRRHGGHRLLNVAAVAVMAAVTGACGFILPDRIHYEWQPDAVCADCAVEPAGAAMVGLAMSGGGSRSAVFSAAVLEALADRGLADQLTHISSVSGGSFAASYYAAIPLAAACPRSGAEDEACRQAYFTAFGEAMRADYATDTVLQQLVRPGRITSPTRRATSLQEVLDDAFLGGLAFGSLADSPVLLINASSYDDGRRFVFSNVVLAELPSAYAPLSSDALRTSSFSLDGCPQPTPPDMPVSLAVVASAAFPPAFGPVAIQAARSCTDPTPQYWHLGDGGIIDNTGADTLRELVVRQVRHGSGLDRALILIADAGMALDPETSRNTRDLSLFTNNPGAVVGVAQLRGEAYAELFWAREQETLGIPFDTIVLRYTNAEIADWPATCEEERAEGRSIAAHIRAIPTALDISDCDADLMAAAARDVVDRRLGEAVGVLRRHGLDPDGALRIAAQ